MTASTVALVSVGGYLGLLGWDQHKTLGADGYLHGPYQAWQVSALIVVLVGAAMWSGWRQDQVIGTLTATLVMTVVWSVDAATDSENDGLWPVGAFLVAVATSVGFFAVSGLVGRIARGQPSRPR